MSSGLDGWLHEKESAWLYTQVAACEPDPAKRDLFMKLGAAAEDQARKWQTSQPGRDFSFNPSTRARIVASLVRRTGPRAARHVLADGRTLFDSYHCSRYNTQTKRLTPAMFEAVFAAIDSCLARG